MLREEHPYSPSRKAGYLPGMQTHLYSPRRSKHVPSFSQGFEAHSLMLTSQRGPVYPLAQSQTKEPTVLRHWPPCSHKCATANTQIEQVSHYLRPYNFPNSKFGRQLFYSGNRVLNWPSNAQSSLDISHIFTPCNDETFTAFFDAFQASCDVGALSSFGKNGDLECR